MTGKTLLLGLAFFICMLLLGSCNPVEETEQEKAGLLKRLDRKFEDPDAHFQLGQLYHADGLWAEAEYHYTTALSFDPVYWPAQAAMVKVLEDRGNTDKANLSAEIYMGQVAASAEKSLQLGLAFQKQKLGEYALACYQQAVQLAPNSAKIHKQIGYYYLRENDKALAREYLVHSFRLDPLQPEVAGELGRLGVPIKIPPRTIKNTKKLDKIVERSEKNTVP